MIGPRAFAGIKAASGVVFLILVAIGSGCRAPQFPPVALASRGWTSDETPVVWRPSAKAPELTGELLFASHEDGSRFIQFSKGGLPVVIAQQSVGLWRISSSLRSGSYGGHGAPPSSIVWFQLRSVPPVAMALPWVLARSTNGSWTVVHSRTGETLEGPGAP